MKLSFVCPVSDPAVAAANVMASQAVGRPGNEILIQSGEGSIGATLNEGVAKASGDFVVVLHQDVWLPPDWETHLHDQLAALDALDPDWGVVGVAGARLADDAKSVVAWVSDRGSPLMTSERLPAEVQTLDELLIVLRPTSRPRFDESLVSHHFYAVDLCLSVAELGLRSYVVAAYCQHNSSAAPNSARQQPGFVEGEDYMRRKWRHRLPVATTYAVVR